MIINDYGKDIQVPFRKNDEEERSDNLKDGKIWVNIDRADLNILLNGKHKTVVTTDEIKNSIEDMKYDVEGLGSDLTFLEIVKKLSDIREKPHISSFNFLSEVLTDVKHIIVEEDLDSELVRNLKEGEFLVHVPKSIVYMNLNNDINKRELKEEDSFLSFNNNLLCYGRHVHQPEINDFVYIESYDMCFNFNGNKWVKAFNFSKHNSLKGVQGGEKNEAYHLSKENYDILEKSKGSKIARMYKEGPLQVFKEIIINHNLDTTQYFVQVQYDNNGKAGAFVNGSGFCYEPYGNNRLKLNNLKGKFWVTIIA